MSTSGHGSRLTLGLVSSGISLLISQQTAYAHERWFVQQGRHSGEQVAMGLPNLLLVLGGVAFIVVMWAIHRAIRADRLRAIVDGARRWLPDGIEWRMVSVLAGIMLIANSVSGVFLAPELVLPGPGLVLLGRVAQAVIGLLLLCQLSFLVSGLLILVVAVPLGTAHFRTDFLIHYASEYIALALAFVLVGLSSSCPDPVAARVGRRWMKREPQDLAHLPLPVIRIGLGLTFIGLALHCKLIDPNLTLTFLDTYDLNFVRQLGFTGFTNPYFVFAACIGETTLGLTLVLGIATRLVAAVLFTALLSTLVMLGPVELVGHLPIMGIVLLLLYRGAGSCILVPQTVGNVTGLAASAGASQSPRVSRA